MSSVTEGNLGLNYGWAYGESGWNTGMDDNLVKLGFTSRNQVKGILSAPPSTPSNGDAYIVGTAPTGLFSGKFANIAIYDRGSWVFITPKSQEVVFNTSDGCDYIYNNGWSLKLEAEVSPYIKIKDFTFSTGYTITDQRQCLLNLADNKYYQWSGAFPKVVAAGATPATSGGIGVGAWSDKTDLMLRSDINIVQKRYACVADIVADTTLTVGKIVETIGYYNGYWGTSAGAIGGNRYEIVAAGTGVDDGGLFITLSNGLQAKAKFSSVIDVSTYGAYGDNYHNDTASIVKALATKLNIYLPKTTSGYYVDGELNLSQGQEIYGDGMYDQSTIYYYGSGTCIKISAYNSSIRNCSIRNLQIKNSGTGLNGIHIYCRGSLDVNDWHRIHNVRVCFFDTQIRVTGRTIWSSFINVDLQSGTNGFIAEYGDAGTMSFNANHFINLRCANMTKEAMKVYKGQACTWETCNFESCNTSNTAGLAAVYIENSESFIFNNCYLESNGFGCTNTKNSPTTCSYGIQFSGTYNYSPKIIGGYNVVTGIPLFINSTNIMGGSVSGGRYDTLSGDAFYIKPGNTGSPYTAGSHPFIIESDCRFDSADSDYINLPLDGNSNRRCSIEQGSSTYWINSDTQTEFDWYRTRNITFNNTGAPARITAFYNQYPGQELTIYNYSGTDAVVIAGTLSKSGSDITIPVNSIATLKVLGYPNDRKVYLANSITI